MFSGYMLHMWTYHCQVKIKITSNIKTVADSKSCNYHLPDYFKFNPSGFLILIRFSVTYSGGKTWILRRKADLNKPTLRERFVPFSSDFSSKLKHRKPFKLILFCSQDVFSRIEFLHLIL